VLLLQLRFEDPVVSAAFRKTREAKDVEDCWKLVAEMIEGRDATQCKMRFKTLQADYKVLLPAEATLHQLRISCVEKCERDDGPWRDWQQRVEATQLLAVTLEPLAKQ
jgi:hypothetical protein